MSYKIKIKDENLGIEREVISDKVPKPGDLLGNHVPLVEDGIQTGYEEEIRLLECKEKNGEYHCIGSVKKSEG